ncbi:MAG TPA: hypothetical protein VEB86_11540 [Chryseosolibacter sp.]|nr:hypothetical protein [Chryseosolibacter sp.]
MRGFTIVHVLLFLLALLVYNCARAQDYVVSIKGDTLRGDTKPIAFGIDKKVQVTLASKKKTTLSIFQVKEFRYRGDLFHPVKNEKGYTFMKLVRGGYLSLYAFQLENQHTYDGLYLVKRDGARTEVPNLGFRKVVGKFLEDCAGITSKIQSGTYGKKDILAVVDEYNECISQRTNVFTSATIRQEENKKDISEWNKLEDQVKSRPEFDGKADVLEMISDIKGKIKRDEKVPNFLVEGLKKSLAGSDDLLAQLDSALNELKSNQ